MINSGMPQIASALAGMEPVDPSILNFAGDGDFLMNGQELATAVQYGAAVLFIVFNNGSYGTIRMHQERDYPARVSGTQLKTPTSRHWRANATLETIRQTAQQRKS